MAKSTLFLGSVLATAGSLGQAQEVIITVEDTTRLVQFVTETVDEFSPRYGVRPLQHVFERGELFFDENTTIPLSFGELRYSSDTSSGAFSSSFQINPDSIPRDLIPEGQTVPEFTVSGETSGVLKYTVDRYDLVFSVYDNQSDTSAFRINAGVGLSMYSFSVTGQIDGNLESLGYQFDGTRYYALHTSNPFINPAVILEFDSQRYFSSGDRIGFTLSGRGEVGNSKLSAIGSYDFRLGNNAYLGLSAGAIYQDYHPALEPFGFDTGWEESASIGYTWTNELQSFSASYNSGKEFNILYEIDF